MNDLEPTVGNVSRLHPVAEVIRSEDGEWYYGYRVIETIQESVNVEKTQEAQI